MKIVYSRYNFFNVYVKISILAFVLILMDISFHSTRATETVNMSTNLNEIIPIPIAWCAVKGSPAANNASIPNPHGGFDTTTEEILDRRAERVSTNIFLDQAEIVFTSNIDNGSQVNNYPIIDDVNTAVGRPGDIVLDNRTNQELARTVMKCKQAWSNMNTTSDFSGITAVNINTFTNPRGEIIPTGGVSACTIMGPCGHFPHTGYITIIDNYYSIPGISSLPPMYDICSHRIWDYWNRDPFDQMLGHEIGRTLGLITSDEESSLMNTCQRFTGPEDTVDNIYLTPEEINHIRQVALNITGIEFQNNTLKQMQLS